MIRVLIAEDMHLIRGALVARLKLEPDTEVVAELDRGDAIVGTARRRKPDVAVLDIDLPGLHGVSAAEAFFTCTQHAVMVPLTPGGAMAVAYSMDLRERVINDAEAGLSSKELAARYHVSRAWVDALKQPHRETNSIAPLKQTKFRRRVLEGKEERLKGLIAAQPDATLAELRAALATSAGLATVWRAIHRLNRSRRRAWPR